MRALPAALIALALAPAAHLDAAERVMVSVLNGQQVPFDTDARGCARFEIDTDANTVTYRVVLSGLIGEEVQAHFHGPAAIGEDAGVVEFLPTGNPKVGVWNYDESLEADILAGRTYVNIHTTMAPGGEIRGQIVDMIAIMDGVQQTPPAATDGSGYGLFMIDTCANEVEYFIEYEGLSAPETAAHIHGFGMHFDGGDVQHLLPAGSPKTGVWNYEQADETLILNGQSYVNVHSEAFIPGELRGAITRIVVPIDGDQATPASGSPGHGCASVVIDPPTDEMSFHLIYGNLTGPTTAAHVHGFAPPGRSASILFDIGSMNPDVSSWFYPNEIEADLLAGLSYFNVHTAMHPGGEIRGQIVFPPPPCPADTNCDGEVDVSDLVNVILAWGTDDTGADVDGDGVVAVPDLIEVILTWGSCAGLDRA